MVLGSLLSFPKSVIFILLNELAERANFYGMKAILVLYLRNKLNYSDDDATAIYHIFVSFVYFFPVFGAIIADSWLGKYKTIFLLSIVYATGSVVISLGAIPLLHLPIKVMTFVGMLLIAIGTGGIKPCVASFGGDQFKLPEQAAILASFFSLFYFAINAGSFFSTLVTPILREDVKCFGEFHCYSLAFGVPAILMIISIVIFVAGKPLYKITKPTGNMVVLVSKCIGNAIVTRWREGKNNARSSWLEYAEPKYGRILVRDVKVLLKILILYLPLPFFWALFDQQSSRWTFQATRMDGKVGGTTIKPDQMQVINPLLILAFIPLFDVAIYPMLAKIGIRRPLQKLTLGGILAAIAFVLSGLVELRLESAYPTLPPSGYTQIRIYNAMPCPYVFNIDGQFENITIEPRNVYLTEKLEIPADGRPFEIFTDMKFIGTNIPHCPPRLQFQVTPMDKEVVGVIAHILDGQTEPKFDQFEDSPTKSKESLPVLRFFMNIHNTSVNLVNEEDNSQTYSVPNMKRFSVPVGTWKTHVEGVPLQYTTSVGVGSVKSYILTKYGAEDLVLREFELSPANSVHMLWQIPQYVTMTAGEVMFSVTGLEFSYSQAPVSMKSVLQACWLLTVAFGNILVVTITQLKFFDSQSAEFFQFATMMAIDMGIFVLIAMRYKYVVYSDENAAEEGEKVVDNNIALEQKANKEGIANKAFNEE
ncbi:peptide transporter family 1-like [Phlebotomus argentipes]|uniref:peptide transporter family 1-like n=1 Tax=Phlebotomus argentipes TaxID=94469 RepID=UPI0028936B40|nr:peptide transporter family 1-like [Phlebotomus argentipes]